jgi:NADPH:quinone reductase-like Zn-dependent oxidoreductase
MGSPRDFARLIGHVENADWHPAIDSVWNLEQLPEAAARLRSRDRFGKIALARHERAPRVSERQQ